MAERVIVTGVIHGQAGRRAELAELLRDRQRQTAAETGCLAARVGATLSDPDEYLTVQEWQDESALEAHYRTAGFREYSFAVTPLLARPSDMRIHRVRETVTPVDSGPPDPRALG